MTAISKPLTSTNAQKNLRLFDARRDLEAVADLVELCFADSLDADGRRYLQRMRSTARNPGLVRWAALTSEWSGMPLNGYVWEQDGRLVGNASVIPHYLGGRRLYLVANIAVHPDYRRQGIARSLVLQAMEHARQRGAQALWLHVREENAGAVALYQSLGFVERTRRTTWRSTPEFGLAETPPGVKFATPRGRDSKSQNTWLKRCYPPEFRWHASLSMTALRPGLWGGLYRLLTGAFIRQWAAFENGRLSAVLTWQAMTSHANALWLAAPPDDDEATIHALLTRARQDLGARHALSLDYPAREYEDAIRKAGFRLRQTLIWMENTL